MKTATAIVLAIVATLGISVARADGIAWEKDYAAALAKAKEAGKPLLVYFTGDW